MDKFLFHQKTAAFWKETEDERKGLCPDIDVPQGERSMMDRFSVCIAIMRHAESRQAGHRRTPMHPSSCLFLIPPRPRDQNPISRFKLDADATLLFAVWAERVPRVYMKREPNR